MLGNFGTHIINFPSKRWGFVGTLPTMLGTEVPATESDVMGCRAHRGVNGELLAWKFPTFETEQQAREHAQRCGVALAN